MDQAPRFIGTASARGYRFIAPVTRHRPESHRVGRPCPLQSPLQLRKFSFDGTSTETRDLAHDLDRLGRRSVCARRTRAGCTGASGTGGKDPYHRAASSSSVRGAGGTRGGQAAI